jgi:hypothetical protein
VFYISAAISPGCNLKHLTNWLISPEVDQPGGEDPSGHAVQAVKRDDGQHRGMECMASLIWPFDTSGPARGTSQK